MVDEQRSVRMSPDGPAATELLHRSFATRQSSSSITQGCPGNAIMALVLITPLCENKAFRDALLCPKQLRGSDGKGAPF